ncbi:MAG: hypothetical protein JOZ25_06875 [Actinobacteria bacterium]|nr:hypothetical protein [Actinomycetota bacterium]
MLVPSVPVKRLFRTSLIAAASALVFAATAYAVTNTVTYSVTLKEKGKPSKQKPARLTYTSTLNVHGPGGTQPDTQVSSDYFYPKQAVLNAAQFPSPCKKSDIDNKTTVPSKCKKALIGKGTATSSAGSPGSAPLGTEPLDLTLYNATGGSQVFLVLNSRPGATATVNHRVIVGTVTQVGGKFGYKTHYDVPADLQTTGPPFNEPATVTTLTLKIGATIKKSGTKVPYIALKSCPKSKKLKGKVTVNFNTNKSTSASTSPQCT